MVDLVRWNRRLASVVGSPTAPLDICLLCVESLDVSGGGISIVTPEGNQAVICATDEIAAGIEDLQVTLGEGPCVDAVRSRAPVLVPDLARPDDVDVQRWPAFTAAAGVAGVVAVFAFPLQIGLIRLGALDVYRRGPGDLNRSQLAAALLAADAAAAALLEVAAVDASSFTDDPRTLSRYHLQVHEATGMVSVQLGVTLEEALVRLRARAFSLDVPLDEVAGAVVERRLRFAREER